MHFLGDDGTANRTLIESKNPAKTTTKQTQQRNIPEPCIRQTPGRRLDSFICCASNRIQVNIKNTNWSPIDIPTSCPHKTWRWPGFHKHLGLGTLALVNQHPSFRHFGPTIWVAFHPPIECGGSHPAFRDHEGLEWWHFLPMAPPKPPSQALYLAASSTPFATLLFCHGRLVTTHLFFLGRTAYFSSWSLTWLRGEQKWHLDLLFCRCPSSYN